MTGFSPQPGDSFFRQVWRIERQIRSERSVYHRVGHDGWPRQELVRFRTSQHLGFAGPDLVEAKIRSAADGLCRGELLVDCMGLTGARGALPVHYTEMVLAQVRARAPALRDFLDLFNHRLLSLFYRSWEKTQPAVHQERQGEDPFSGILRALTNAGPGWEVYYGAALARGVSSASTLRATLSDLTQVPVTLRSLVGGWAALAHEDQTRLPDRRYPQGQHARLGEALLGSQAWLADQGVQIVFHPRNQQQLQSLLPGGRFSAAIAQLTRRLMGGRIQVRYRLVVTASTLADVCLGRQGRLGADSFIAGRGASGQKVEVSFKPKHA